MTWLIVGLIVAGAVLGFLVVTLAKRGAATPEGAARRAAAARAGVMLVLAAILVYNAITGDGAHRYVEFTLAAVAIAAAIFDLRYRQRQRQADTR